MIKQAGVEDIPAIITVAEATWEPTYRDFIDPGQISYMFDRIYSAESLRQQMTESGHTFLLLYRQDAPVAFASFSPREDDPAVFKMHKLYLMPREQGKGLGKILIGDVSRRVKQAGGQWLDLNVNRYNPARHFYERTGFRILREEDIPYGPYWLNDYVMRRAV